MSDRTETPTTDPEARLREVLAAPHRYEVVLGDWNEWTKGALTGYNALTVTARSTLSHLHGQHDDTENPYAHCVVCAAFRLPDAEVDSGSEGGTDA